MLPEADLVRLQHMLDAANEALEFAEGKGRGDLDTERMLSRAIVRDIEIIGEAAANVSAAAREMLPRIPWPQVVSMRNRLIHGYFDIDHDRVWDTVTDDLPALIQELATALQGSRPEENA
jgi:uncharacterized protein with HEPN domain